MGWGKDGEYVELCFKCQDMQHGIMNSFYDDILEIPDHYIKNLLKSTNKELAITPELIEAKRQQIKLHRLCKQNQIK